MRPGSEGQPPRFDPRPPVEYDEPASMDNLTNGRKTPALLLVLLAFLLPLGCRRGGGSAVEKAPGTPRRGGTLVVAWTAEPGGVNTLIVGPTQLNDEFSSQLFLHLLEEQPDFEQHPPTFKPQLARSYD